MLELPGRRTDVSGSSREHGPRLPDPTPPDSATPDTAPTPESGGTLSVDGVALDSVRGFEDLPEESQARLVRVAKLTSLSADEEVGSFGAALVTRGKVGIMSSVADVSGSIAVSGEVVFTRGTLEDGVPLRVVALEDGTVVASWSAEELALGMADCPWVGDELRLVADRFQALAGATLGLLGERLDDSLRGMVMSRLDVKAFEPGEVIVSFREARTRAAYRRRGSGRAHGTAMSSRTRGIPAIFSSPRRYSRAARAQSTARAGKDGALILHAPRAIAHELLMSVPPLLEITDGLTTVCLIAGFCYGGPPPPRLAGATAPPAAFGGLAPLAGCESAGRSSFVPGHGVAAPHAGASLRLPAREASPPFRAAGGAVAKRAAGGKAPP